MPHEDPVKLDSEARAALALSLLGPVRGKAPVGTSSLDAFVHAREETSADFARSFLTLSRAERHRLVAADEDQDADAAPVLMTPSEEATVSAVMEALLNEKPSAADTEHTLALRGAEACATVDAADTDDLEEVDLATVKEVRTGRMVAFFDHGDTTDTTTFDNYVDEDGGETRASTAGDQAKMITAGVVELDGDEMATLLKNASTLDDFLRISSENDEHEDRNEHQGSLPSIPQSAPVAAVDARTPDRRGDGPEPNAEARCSPSEDLSCSEDGESEPLALPGVGDDEDGTVARTSSEFTAVPQRKPSVTMDACMRESLRAIAAEADDTVYTFSLDPLYDYDADTVGASARSGVDRKHP